jgi:Trk K+ transport system NAD-binding subunit
LGHHFNSEALAAKIAAESPELLKKILVIDFDLQNHPRIRAIGMDVVYGDISNSEVLRHFGVSEAKVVVCTIGDTFLRGTSNEELLGVVKSINPDARVITTASVRQIIDGTAVSGAWACISPEIESATAYLAAIRKALKS